MPRKINKINHSGKTNAEDKEWVRIMSPHLDRMVDQSLNKYCKYCGQPIISAGDGMYEWELTNEAHLACARRRQHEERVKLVQEEINRHAANNKTPE